MKAIEGKEKIFFGINSDNERIYIYKPTWECKWYWSFGYLGNKNCHYHLEAYQSIERMFKLKDGGHALLTEKRNKCMRDCLLEDYNLNPAIIDNLWVFCELALSIYSLKEAAEVIGRSGSHMTTNPCKNVITNKTETARLNERVIPELCQTLWDLIS
jgi:hypothetical protein